MIQLGDVRVHLLGDGDFALDGGAMFGIVPRVLWQRSNPPDERNRVALGLHVALIETAGRKLLVDPGVGDKWSEKERDMFRIERSLLLAKLEALGIRRDEIDTVINTHLHFDHSGGNTCVDDGRIVPTFPQARYVVQAGEWHDATHTHERNRASYRPENFEPLEAAGVLDRIEGEEDVAPGVRVVPVGGHTRHHQIVVVKGGGRSLIIPTDVLPTTSHVPLPYVMAFDLDPAGTVAAKKKLLERAVEDESFVLFYHDARIPLGRIREESGRYRVDEVES